MQIVSIHPLPGCTYCQHFAPFGPIFSFLYNFLHWTNWEEVVFVMPFTFKSIYASFLRIRLVSWITIVIDFSNTVRILLSNCLFIFQFCQWPINTLHSIFLPSRIEFSLGFVIFLVSFILNISFDFCDKDIFERIQSSPTPYLIEWCSVWFVWYFFMIKFRLCIPGQNTRKIMLCPSQGYHI